MAELKEECVYIKLYFKQAKHSMETFKMLKVALGEQALGRTQVSEWIFRFKVV
jgi:hypothetical protein